VAEVTKDSSTAGFWDRLVDACPNLVGVTVATAGKTLSDIGGGIFDIFTGHGAQVADMVEARAAETARFFDSLGDSIVDRFPNSGGAALATAVSSVPRVVLSFGTGLSDTARIGTGVAQGTLGGVAKDVLRAITVISPAFTTIQELRLARLAKVYVDPAPGLGACLPVSITKALRQVGQGRAYASLDEMVSGVVKSPIGAASLDLGRTMRDMVADLKRLGADFHLLKTSETLEGLREIVRARPHGVTVFGAEWKQLNAATGKMEPAGHALYAFIDKLGRFRIADRSSRIVSSLKDLENFYSGISSATIQRTAMFIPKARYLVTTERTGSVGLLLNIVSANRQAKPSLSNPQAGARSGR